MTETAPERLGAIRAALAELVAEHGCDPLSDSGRMSNLIKDLLPDDQQLARILTVAAEQDVASQLREHASAGMDAPTATRLVATSFAATTMFDAQACSWVVSELAVAMGLAPADRTEDVSPRPGMLPTDPAPASVDAPPPYDVPTYALRVADRSPRQRRKSYLAIAAVGVAVVVTAVILALKGSPASTLTNTPPQGSFVINRQFASNGSFALTLTTIKVSHNLMTVYVTYHNTGSLPQILTCLTETDPSASSLTLANGEAVHSAATYCSDHPGLADTVGPGATRISYAKFRLTHGLPEPFAFHWEAGDLSGTVPNIRI